MMTNEKQITTGSEICTIKILFPVESDSQALDAKKKIQEILSDMTDVQIDFRLMSGRVFTAPPPDGTH